MNLFWKSADGSGDDERLTTSDGIQIADSWPPSGRYIAYQDTGTDTGRDIWILDRSGERKRRPYLKTSFDEGGAGPLWSPDGRELFYVSGSRIMAVDVEHAPAFRAGKPRELFQVGLDQPLFQRNYDVSGRRPEVLHDSDAERAAGHALATRDQLDRRGRAPQSPIPLKSDTRTVMAYFGRKTRSVSRPCLQHDGRRRLHHI